MWRTGLVAAAVLGLAACEPLPSNVSTAEAQSYEEWQAQRDAELTGRAYQDPNAPLEVIPLPEPGAEGLLPAGDAPTEASQTAAPLPAVPPAPQTADAGGALQPLGIDGAAPASPPVGGTSSGGFSTENDFDAVSGQRSIEDDAERLARIREQYEEVAPTELPDRPGASQPNIVAYALSTTNPVGMSVYPRLLRSERRFLRNCGTYVNADQAQQDFLARGGPERDPRGLDPDGDGYACGWDPSPFRVVLQEPADN